MDAILMAWFIILPLFRRASPKRLPLRHPANTRRPFKFQHRLIPVKGLRLKIAAGGKVMIVNQLSKGHPVVYIRHSGRTARGLSLRLLRLATTADQLNTLHIALKVGDCIAFFVYVPACRWLTFHKYFSTFGKVRGNTGFAITQPLRAIYPCCFFLWIAGFILPLFRDGHGEAKDGLPGL